MTINDIFKQAGSLPAIKIAQSLNTTLHTHNVAVVTAPPGAGKSTLLPLTLMTEFHNAGKILMLEPRRIAALDTVYVLKVKFQVRLALRCLLKEFLHAC